MDQRGSGGQKRARGDGPQNEGDWTCPQCGNVNFAFRTNCNLRKCNAPKPSYPPQRVPPVNPSMYEPMTTPYYMGSAGGPPPQMPLGMTTSYGVPMGPPAAGIPYDYSTSINIPPSYGAMSLQTPYGPPGGVGGGGMGYGAGHGMEGAYGMNYGMTRGPMLSGPGSGMYMEENGSRKRRGDTSEGDWTCPKCGNTNFAFRTICNMRKCNTPKPAPQPFRGQGKSSAAGEGLPEGSWTCDQCGNVNYSFRTKCNRRNCGAPKPDGKQQGSKMTANTQ
ncbi:hypothetical protein GOP47_0026744 [Adiantum capillus-veneris]|nr:hypothetical protein GOP47_0026744 [Adiantum capillus-veneris]